MIERMHHQLEVVGETATLYITGSLGREHIDTLIDVCAAAPSRARTLRLDLHGLGQLSAESINAVRQLLRFWRDTRQGEFRLTTSHMLATLREVRDARVPAPTDWYPPRTNEALAATYL
jgi:ABC-type transporter Mla MlaB component